MSETPGYLATLDYARRWGVEPMFSNFKTRGFGFEDSQIRYPDRLARMAPALYFAVSTGQWDAARHACRTQTPGTAAEKRLAQHDVVVHPRSAAHRQPAPNPSAHPTTLGRSSN